MLRAVNTKALQVLIRNYLYFAALAAVATREAAECTHNPGKRKSATARYLSDELARLCESPVRARIGPSFRP